VAAIGAAVILACAALIALVGQASEAPRAAELVAVSKDAHINALAREFLDKGAQMTQAEAINRIRNWNNEEHVAKLMASPARTQMLAGNKLLGARGTQALAGDSLLCEKRAKIIDLFDQLLKKLGGEELSANITMGRVTKEWKEAMESWLTAESNYRLTVEKMRDAREGSTYAQEEYEKWKTAYKKAKSDLDATLARHDAERQSLLQERELIKMIMRYIGVLHDIKATEKSIAAGGRDSIKDEETGVSNPYDIKKTVSPQELKAKLTKLQELVLKTNLPGATQKLAQIQQLPVYSETEEVAKILMEMLDDLATRLSVIDEVDEQAKKMVDDAYAKMLEWEKKLVVLANEADKAKEKMLKEKLEREKLAGDKDVATQTHDTESAAYKLVITPYQREIYVITMIKIKINEHCEKLANGEESTFGERR
jgi:hypothetical protein